jgi:hypothetical protein
VHRKKDLGEKIPGVLQGLGNMERRLRSVRKNLHVVLVIILCYMLTSGHDSAASAVYFSLSPAYLMASIRSMPLLLGWFLD